jgi:hypothetical protein
MLIEAKLECRRRMGPDIPSTPYKNIYKNIQKQMDSWACDWLKIRLSARFYLALYKTAFYLFILSFRVLKLISK